MAVLKIRDRRVIHDVSVGRIIVVCRKTWYGTVASQFASESVCIEQSRTSTQDK